MKHIKIFLPILVLFLSIGYAATNITLSISGDIYIASEYSDLNVYISGLKVNGIEKASMLTSATSFEGVYPTITGEDYFTIELTNASKSFDIETKLVCDSYPDLYGTNYYIPTETEMPVTIKAKSSMTFEFETTYWEINGDRNSLNLSCYFEINPIERKEYGEGEVNSPLERPLYSIGDEIKIGTEYFNIMKIDGETYTLLGKYNLKSSSTELIQTATENSVKYSTSTPTVADTSGNVEITSTTGNIYTFITEYSERFEVEPHYLIMSDFDQLECEMTDDGDASDCSASPHSSWLLNGQTTWISTYSPNCMTSLYVMQADGMMICSDMSDTGNFEEYGIRPTIQVTLAQLMELDTFQDNTVYGQEITIANEKFNIVNQTVDTVRILAQYNLGTDYKQSTTANYVVFADTWDDDIFAIDGETLDIQLHSSKPKEYVNEYINYLKSQSNFETISASLLKNNDMLSIGCQLSSLSYSTCASTEHEWIINGQKIWLNEYHAVLFSNAKPEIIEENGAISNQLHSLTAGVRPVIILDIAEFNEYILNN